MSKNRASTDTAKKPTDKQRMDWLEDKRALISWADVGPMSPGGPHVCASRENYMDQDMHFFGATYREAIDKAMKATNQ